MRIFREPDWDALEESDLECRCGAPMLLEPGLVIDVYRCRECGREGARGPIYKAIERVGGRA